MKISIEQHHLNNTESKHCPLEGQNNAYPHPKISTSYFQEPVWSVTWQKATEVAGELNLPNSWPYHEIILDYMGGCNVTTYKRKSNAEEEVKFMWEGLNLLFWLWRKGPWGSTLKAENDKETNSTPEFPGKNTALPTPCC